MADQRDLELLDDYLTHRLSDQDRTAFEQKLQADPDLQHEYALQRRLIKGIKDARISELKSMLNNVPVPAAGTGNTLGTKIILGTVVTLMIVAVSYWYISHEDAKLAEPQAPAEQQIKEQPVTPSEVQPENMPEEKTESQEARRAADQDKNQTSAGTEHSKPSLAKKPDPLEAPGDKSPDAAPTKKEPVLDVFDPGAESTKREADIAKDDQRALSAGKSTLQVETDRDNSRYKFHYQFRDGKLFLFGPFEQNLYEIMEFFADEKRTVFLFYKDKYYRLDEADSKIRSLEPITDAALLKKLNEYRSSK